MWTRLFYFQAGLVILSATGWAWAQTATATPRPERSEPLNIFGDGVAAAPSADDPAAEIPELTTVRSRHSQNTATVADEASTGIGQKTAPADGHEAPSTGNRAADADGQDATSIDEIMAAASENEDKPVRRNGEGSNVDYGAQENAAMDRNSAADMSILEYRDLWPLGVVIALILIVAWIVKRYMPNRRLMTGTGVVDVVSRTPISARQQLVLVKMGRRLLLLGVSPESITTLCDVTDPDQVALLVGQIASRSSGSMTQAFEESFANETGLYDEMDEPADPEQEVSGQVRGLLDKIRQISQGQGVA